MSTISSTHIVFVDFLTLTNDELPPEEQSNLSGITDATTQTPVPPTKAPPPKPLALRAQHPAPPPKKIIGGQSYPAPVMKASILQAKPPPSIYTRSASTQTPVPLRKAAPAPAPTRCAIPRSSPT